MFVALAMLVTACGGDDDSSSGNTASSTTVASDEPVVGGEATILLFNEIASFDPVRMTGSAGADGQRAFPVYGALVTYDGTKGEIQPLLAESLEPGEGFDEWNLVLRDGLVFSDGSQFDANAVKVNWERAQVPENRSPSLSVARTISSMTVVDAQTLRIGLVAPNAHFPVGLARTGLNYIASAQAIRSGVDLTSSPVGAGPFLLDDWLRDSQMVLVRNPDWFDAPRPYLDRIEFRVVGDEEQRIDTLVTGGAELAYNAIPSTRTRALDEGVAGFVGVPLGSSQAITLNNSAPPFNDARVRRAFVLGFDRDALGETMFGEGVVVAHNFVPEDSPWYAPEGDLPPYDPEEAQRLIDEVVAEQGGPIEFTLGSFQQTQNQETAKFIQTSLSQLDGIEVAVDVADSPTAIQRVMQAGYQAHTWGYPILDPDPGAYNALHSTQPANFSKYSNVTVDRALDEARVTDDFDTRKGLYADVFAQAAEDLPWVPIVHPVNGFLFNEGMHDVTLYEDSILRSDLLWRS